MNADEARAMSERGLSGEEMAKALAAIYGLIEDHARIGLRQAFYKWPDYKLLMSWYDAVVAALKAQGYRVTLVMGDRYGGIQIEW